MDTNTVEAFRLSPQQRQLWMAQHDSRAFRSQAVVRLDGPLDPRALEAAVAQTVRRHEALRTTFRMLEGVRIPFQVIDAGAAPSWRGIDWTARPIDEQADGLERLAAEERHQPFDLERGPVVRLCLVQLRGDKHVLVITVPALCADAATMINFVSQVARFYAAPAAAPDAEAASLQYADFAAWANELLESADADAEAARSFWGREEAASIPPTVLPFEMPISPEAKFAPLVVTRRFNAIAASGLSSGAAQMGVSSSAWLLAAVDSLLWRFTGQQERVLRYVTSGRKFEEMRDAMGLFAKPVPVQGRCDGAVQFAAVAKNVHERLSEADAWQEYFADGSMPEARRTTSSTPAVDVECISLPEPVSGAGLSFRLTDLGSIVAPFKMKFTAVGRGDEWTLGIGCSPEAYTRPAVERLAAALEALLTSAARQPETTLAELEVLDEAARQELLGLGAGPTVDEPATTIHALVDAQADRTPAAVAVVGGGAQLTFGELRARANQLAHWLRRQSVSRGQCVGLCVDRSVEMVVALLGIAKAGAAYVPLSVDNPPARLRHQIAETGIELIVTAEPFLGALPEPGVRAICLDRDAAVLASEPTTDPEPTAGPEDPVYVLYTSGSTGTPKGVAVRHRNLVNYTRFMTRRFEASTSDGGPLHFATVSTLAADLGNTAIFPSLVMGGCLHVIGYAEATDAAAFARYVAEHAIDVLKIVPSHLQALLACEPAEAVLPRKHLVLGGEALTWDLADRVLAVSGGPKVTNHYGPTEATVGSLVFDLEPTSPPRRLSRTVPVGRPIANTDVYILDERRELVPLGVAGELYIGGAGVAAGYIGQPELTAERFVPNPFHPDRTALYRTGDRARYLPDGSIEFLGRVDHQVKIRGFRIELGEVEAALGAHPAIREGVAAIHGSDDGEKQLVAYVVRAAESTVGIDELRGFLRERVPEYMVPAAFVVMRTLPLTPNGKVDRAALPAPDAAPPDRERPFEPPRTPIEQSVAALWAQLLKQPRVGLRDNFFALGGHSLLVTQVVSRLRSEFHVELPLRTIFEQPTVEGVALVIAQQTAQREDPAALNPILAELDSLSDEDAARLLDSRLPPIA